MQWQALHPKSSTLSAGPPHLLSWLNWRGLRESCSGVLTVGPNIALHAAARNCAQFLPFGFTELFFSSAILRYSDGCHNTGNSELDLCM